MSRTLLPGTLDIRHLRIDKSAEGANFLAVSEQSKLFCPEFTVFARMDCGWGLLPHECGGGVVRAYGGRLKDLAAQLPLTLV
jgi:hypothetical protein